MGYTRDQKRAFFLPEMKGHKVTDLFFCRARPDHTINNAYSMPSKASEEEDNDIGCCLPLSDNELFIHRNTSINMTREQPGIALVNISTG